MNSENSIILHIILIEGGNNRSPETSTSCLRRSLASSRIAWRNGKRGVPRTTDVGKAVPMFTNPSRRSERSAAIRHSQIILMRRTSDKIVGSQRRSNPYRKL